MARHFHRIHRGLLLALATACLSLALGAQGAFPSVVAGVIGNWNPAQAGRPRAAGLGFDYGEMSISPGSHVGGGFLMGFGYDRVARFQGARFDFQGQLLLAPQPIRNADHINSLFYADGGVGLHVGAPYHGYVYGGLGVHLVIQNHFMPFLEVRRRLPMATSQWRETRIVFGIHFLGVE